MLSFSPMAQIVNPDFRVVIDLGETLGGFYRDLGDKRFDAVQDQFTGETSGYIARGMIHNLLKIPGGMTIRDACQFFPGPLQDTARLFLEQFWHTLSTEISRMEGLIRAQNSGRHFDACVNPAPMVDGYSTLTIWYAWKSELQVLQDSQLQLEPEPLGF